MKKIDTFARPESPKRRRDDEFEVLGTGGMLLPLQRPGFRLKKLTSVLVEGQEMPLRMQEEYPADHGGALERAEIELVSLREEGGQQVLVRSVKSNDGIWQGGGRFVVCGQWERR